MRMRPGARSATDGRNSFSTPAGAEVTGKVTLSSPEMESTTLDKIPRHNIYQIISWISNPN